ncbi:MAG: cadmium-translocating P-type ATPase [Clostridia bacterium]|nr:cadmium-translocating P-type ATPase [Clostridia bacterium]
MNEYKNDIIKITVSAITLIIAVVLTKVIQLPLLLQIIIFAVPYLIVGLEVIKEAIENITEGEIFGEELLMCIATVGAFVIKEYPEAVFVMIFFCIGELFEDMASNKSRKSITALMDIRPDIAYKEENGKFIEVKCKEVKTGDILTVRSGNRIPLDGIILDGNSLVDTSALTGESLPKSVSVGDSVFGGCVNIGGVIKIRVTNEYEHSTASKILDLAENAYQKKAKTEKFITKFSKVYTPIVVCLALFIAVIPSIISNDWYKWLYTALTFLVVSCPCAVVISIPLTYFSGIGCSSRHGILVKGSDSLEALSNLKTAVFDKTGTLTLGNFEVTAIHPEKIDEMELLSIAVAAEDYSTHPISMSLKRASTKGGCKTNKKVSQVKEIAGKGITAVIDGNNVCVGNGKLMDSIGVEYRNCHHTGTIVHIAVDGEYEGHIVISDTVKPDSKKAITRLKKLGIKSIMLTGDGEATAKAVAEDIGINEYHCDLMPEDKVNIFESILKDNNSNKKVAFIGDGINDTPVLSRADIGISMGGLGSDAAIEAADVVLMDDNLLKLDTAIKISKRTKKIAYQNIIFALGVKFGVLLLSLFTVPNIMWFAAFADVGVMVIAVLNSIRAMKLS